MKKNNNNYLFGDKLRKVREKKKITLKEVAKRIGTSESLVSQIETNKVSPAIDTLLKIADALELDLEYLFSDFKKGKIVNLVRFKDRNKMLMHEVVYEQLSKTIGGDEEHGIEAYYLEIKIGGEKGSKEYGHKGRELGIIIEGQGEFLIGNKSYELYKGDSISFDSDVPHVLKNTGNIALKAYWIITPPKMFFKEM
ncbi:MAG: helix-turn-helix domain-containing protein [Fusobacteriaceae bacterium]|nr:helix-turn-helix domain-containing protein [Fusobacteriaceae bacterium]